jgi:hypothetical protein
MGSACHLRVFCLYGSSAAPKKNISLGGDAQRHAPCRVWHAFRERNERRQETRNLHIQARLQTATRAGRAVFHGVADVFTLGLWEVVGTRTELVFQGEEMAFDVSYDENDRIDKVTVLQKK